MLNHPHLVARLFIGKCSSKTLMTAHHDQPSPVVVTVRRLLEYHYHCSFFIARHPQRLPSPTASFPLKSNSSSACQPLKKDGWKMQFFVWDGSLFRSYLKLIGGFNHFPKVRGEYKKHLKPGLHSQTSFWNRVFAKQNLDQEVGKHGYTRNPFPEIECMMTMMTIPPKDHHKGIPWFIQGGVDQAFCSYNLSISNQNDDRTTHFWTNSQEIRHVTLML